MSVLRFDSEQEYRDFLAAYHSPQKKAQEGQSVAISVKNGLTPTDGAKRLLQAILAADIEGPWYREFVFHEDRNWALDVACPRLKLGCEVDGMVHRIKKRFLGDMTKHNALTLAGWRWVRCTPAQVDSGEALVLLKALVDGGVGERRETVAGRKSAI